MIDHHLAEQSVGNPTLAEALERLEMLREQGESPDAFGWDYLKDATMWKTHGCQVAAE
ncbi:DUF3291 domain-containing protein [Litoreibacter albidus]|uniref:DUF3291 domain-containing protein n=1 Tax=Litoreibacter albidus TaxID=670155 RepID=A0A1H2RXR3_9RHOB|nr:DUF3291 domain-containing protein [Litoreibacter albidus]SDW24088.1 protein of unknown function [Litoreibacter albidus]